MESAQNTLWRIDALKFDQQLHYRLHGTFMDDDGACLWVRAEAGTLLEHITRGFVRPMRRRSDMYFWRDRWYNVYLNYDLNGELEHAYCNVGLPPVITQRSVTYVDMDLDLRLWPDGRIELLDEDEFSAHARLYRYPQATQENARQAIDALLALWEASAPPFDRLRQ